MAAGARVRVSNTPFSDDWPILWLKVRPSMDGWNSEFGREIDARIAIVRG